MIRQIHLYKYSMYIQRCVRHRPVAGSLIWVERKRRRKKKKRCCDVHKELYGAAELGKGGGEGHFFEYFFFFSFPFPPE